LQRYLDQMGTLIIDKDLRTAEDPEVRTLARARTATVIQRLDADGNRNVVRFLNEASLTGAGQSSLSLLAEADLRGARLEGVDLSTMDLRSANLRNARLKDADLSDANLSDADLSNASLSGATLIGADMSDASLRHANLSNTSLYGADLSDADLSRATLSGNLERVSLYGADLYGADLSGADLDGADMRNSALSGANLRNASLWSSILVDAGLSGADLSNAHLSNADLDRAHLHGIFEDDFSDTSNGWDTGIGSETEPSAIEYHTDRFRMYNPPPSNTLMSFNRSVGSEIKDVSVEVDASVSGNIPHNSDSLWGILCRSDDQNKDMYVLGIFADGTSAIYKLENNNWEMLSSREPTDAFRSGADTNHLRPTARGVSWPYTSTIRSFSMPPRFRALILGSRSVCSCKTLKRGKRSTFYSTTTKLWVQRRRALLRLTTTTIPQIGDISDFLPGPDAKLSARASSYYRVL
jgi:uncharacterized protein YjbI with pentapeptide repeats